MRAATTIMILLMAMSQADALDPGLEPPPSEGSGGSQRRTLPRPTPNAAGISARVRIETGGGVNALLGAATNNTATCRPNTPGSSCAFPTGVTGYGGLRSTGNAVFGLFGRADCYTPGICTNEVDSFNYAADAPTQYPWSRSFGGQSPLPIALTVAAGGPYASAAGIELAAEGQKPSHFHHGIVIRAGSVTEAGLLMDATGGLSPLANIVLRNSGGPQHRFLDLKTMGPGQPDDAVLVHRDATGRVTLNLTQGGSITGAGALQGAAVVAQSNTYPVLATHNLSGGPDAQIWEWMAQGSTLVLRAVNDTYSKANSALTLTRAGATVTGVTVGAPLTVEAPLRGKLLEVAGPPTANDIAAGQWTVVKRQDDASMRLCANDGVAIRCTALQ